MFKKLVSLLGLALLLQPPCRAASATSQTNGSNDFSIKLFRTVSKDSSSNVVVSPYSINTALSMTTLGAKGITKSEMQQSLGYAGMTDQEIEQFNSDLSHSLSKVNPASEFAIANALFPREGIPLKKSFVDKNESLFNAKLQSLNFSNKKATLDVINGWVKVHTQGKIDSILDDIPPDAILYLINAIYFKGTWENPFSESETIDTHFNLIDGKKSKVRMMYRTAKMRYLEGPNFQAVALPYSDKRLELCVFLPDEGAIDSFVASLDPQVWKDWMNKFHTRKGELGLPKTKIEYKKELSGSLQQIGMKTAFNQSADFSEMIDFSKIERAPVHISRVLHKTFLEIDEKGTTAAAVTAVEMVMRGSAGRPEQPFRMICDRPYVLALRDSETGTILFLGKIMNPSQ